VTRGRWLGVAAVAAFLAAFFALGAVSRNSPASTSATASRILPTANWYWTVAVSPTDTNTLVLATGNGLFRSSDGGKTWKPVGPKSVNATSVVVSRSTMYAGGVHTHGLAQPIVQNAGGRTAPNGPGFLQASSDGGATWHAIHPSGLPGQAVQALAVDPASATVIYALLTSGAVYRSSDGAKSFQLVSKKLGGPPWSLAVTPAGLVSGDMDTGAYVAGKKIAFTDPRGTKMVMEYAPQPGNPSQVLLSSYGVEQSNDGGKTFHPVLKSSVMFGPVAYAPSDTKTAYAAGFDGSLWRSADGGKTWSPVG